MVYKFTCQSDSDEFYLGETKRHIGIRAGEHLDLSSNCCTAIGKHIKSCENCYDKWKKGLLSYKDFEIIKCGRSKFEIEIHEALLIKKLNPPMNKQLFKGGTSFTLKVFV